MSVTPILITFGGRAGQSGSQGQFVHEADSLQRIGEWASIGLVIDCGTKWLSILAAISFVRNSGAPLIFMDCAQANDMPDINRLAPDVSPMIHVVRWPLNRHGVTLDRFFSVVRAEFVYLIDSDAELTDCYLAERMMSAVRKSPDSYGSGMLHRKEILSAGHMFANGAAEYQERMWIPFVLLRTGSIKAMLDQGESFAQRTEYPALTGYRCLDGLLGLRHRIAGGRRNIHPGIREFDTGASVHAAMKARGWSFEEVPGIDCGVIHLHGATRRILPSPLRRFLHFIGIRFAENATDIADVSRYAKCRLTTRYGYHVNI